MKRAAGILMIFGAIMEVTMLRAIYGTIPGILGWLNWIFVGIILLAGISLLKRKKLKRKKGFKIYHCPNCGQQLEIPEGESRHDYECPDCGASL